MKRDQIEEIVYMRGIAMLAVVLIHISVVGYRAVDITSSSYPIYMFMNRFFRFGTPTFIFITGLVMFYGYYYKQINGAFLKKFVKSRLLFIFVPYLVWALFYKVYRILAIPNLPYTTKEFWVAFFEKVLHGTSFYHFYFFIVLIQLYLMFPVLLYMAQKWKWFRYSLPLIGLVVQVGMYVSNYYWKWMPSSGSFFASFFLYFCLGAFIGIYFEQITTFLKKKYVVAMTLVMVIIGTLYVWNFHRLIEGLLQRSPLVIEFTFFVFASISAVTLLGITRYFIKEGPALLRKPLKQLGLFSFGIFLVHPLVINLLDYLLIWEGSRVFHVGTVLRFILTVAISYLLIYVTNRYVPFSSYIVGKYGKVSRVVEGAREPELKQSI